MILAELHKQTLTASEKFNLLEKINRDYLPLLSPAEYTVLMFIFARTIQWGRKAEFIRQKHFLEGIPDTIGPVPIKERNLVTIIQKLVGKGIVIREINKNGSWYAINFDWNVVMLRTPKPKENKEISRLKVPKGGTAKIAGGVLQKLQDRNTRIIKYEKEVVSEAVASQTSKTGLTIKESLDQANQRHAKAYKKKMDKAASAETPGSLSVLWHARIKELYPEMPYLPWTKKEWGQIKNFMIAYRANGKVWPMLEFAIENWKRIGTLKFEWKDGITFPEYPNLGFFIGFKKDFVAAYADKEFLKRSLKLTQREREIAKLMRLGYTEEQAVAEVDRSAENSKVAVKYKKAAEEANRDNRILTEKLKQVEREKTALQIQKGRELLKKERLNPGSSKNSVQKEKRDKDGYREFKPVTFDKWQDDE